MKLKKAFSAIIALILLFSFCIGCAGNPTPTENAPSATPQPDEEETVLYSGVNKLSLKASDDGLYIVELSGENGAIVSDSRYDMPQRFTFMVPDGYDIKSGDAIPDSCELTKQMYTADWKYQGKTVSEITVDGVNKTVAKFTFKDINTNTDYIISCTGYPGNDGMFEFQNDIINNSAADILYEAGNFFCITGIVPENTPVAWTFDKEACTASGFEYIDQNKQEIVSLGGNGIDKTRISRFVKVETDTSPSRKGNLPIIYLDCGDSGVITALEWSSGTVGVENDLTGMKYYVNLASNETGGAFKTYIRSGNTISMPAVYFGCYSGDIEDGSNMFKRWFFNCKTNSKLRDNEKEPYIQTDDYLYAYGISLETLAAAGIESMKWDYGWWNVNGFVLWSGYEGSWKLRSIALKNMLQNLGVGFDGYADYLENLGLSWALYVPLHDTLDDNGEVIDTEGEFNSKTHPDWFSTFMAEGGSGMPADLGNEECVEYIKTTLLELFKTNKITTWRSDLNPISRFSDNVNRHMSTYDDNASDVAYWCTVGFFDIVDYLYENYDKFRYESCCNGGDMKDFMTATRAIVINCDDSQNYLSLRTSFYDSSYCFHPTQLQLPANPDRAIPSHPTFWPIVESDQEDLDEALMKMAMRSLVLGAVHVNGFSDTRAEYYQLYAAKLRPIIRDGDLYHVLPRPDGTNWDGVMYADADSAEDIKGVLFAFKPSTEAENEKNVKLRGLNADTMYRVVFEDGTSPEYVASGVSLMNDGVTIKINGVGSEMVWIYEA